MSFGPIFTVGFVLAVVVTGFHCCAIYVSVTSKDLKKVRFLRLALFLSFSDGAMGFEYLYLNVLNQLNSSGEAIKFQCMLIKDIISGTILSSLLQTMIICLERLNATFTIPRRSLKILTGNIAVGFCFAIPHCYTIFRFGMNAVDGLAPCAAQYTIGPLTLLTHDIPAALIITSIAIIYGIVAKRMISQQKTRVLPVSNLSEVQIQKNKDNALRMRKNMATLGMIIAVAVISALPRGLLGLYAYAADAYDTIEPYLLFSNNILILLTPLLDPVIYLFRIQKYRHQLMCRRCIRSNAVADLSE